MSLLEADYCDKESFNWSVISPRKDVGPHWDNREAVRPDRDLDWPRKARDRYEIGRRVKRAYRWYRNDQKTGLAKVRPGKFRESFRVLASQWYRDTMYLSITSKAVSHPAYFEIVAMGTKAIPLILEELRERPAQWFIALRAITKVDPAPKDANPSAARQAWLNWGIQNGYIS